MLHKLEKQDPVHPSLIKSSDANGYQPARLVRLANLTCWYDASEQQTSRSERLDQIEHALAILASVVTRLSKGAHQTRLPLRPTECDLPEERTDRPVKRLAPESAQEFAQGVLAIRSSLNPLLKRRPRTPNVPA